MQTTNISDTLASLPLPTSTHLDHSYQAFLRDLPALLAKYPGQWVAYAGETCLGVNSSKRALYRDCVAAGHCDRDFLICGIEQPQSPKLDPLSDV